MEYPLIELGGMGRTLNLAVANGFPPQTYLPMLRPLMADVRVVSLLPRALWGGQPVPETLGTWETDLTPDMLEGMRRHGLTGIIGMGHSFGGISTLLAALNAPSRFAALVLLDPTILSPEVIAFMRASRARGTIREDFPLAARAIKRQRQFTNRNEAYAYFRPRGAFKDWEDAAVREYVAHGLADNAEGVALSWPPEWEAYYYSTVYGDIWDALPRLAGLLPTLIVRGAESDTYTAESAAAVRDILPAATHAEIPGHGHLFPHSAPRETATIVGDWLNTLNLLS